MQGETAETNVTNLNQIHQELEVVVSNHSEHHLTCCARYCSCTRNVQLRTPDCNANIGNPNEGIGNPEPSKNSPALTHTILQLCDFLDWMSGEYQWVKWDGKVNELTLKSSNMQKSISHGRFCQSITRSILSTPGGISQDQNVHWASTSRSCTCS